MRNSLDQVGLWPSLWEISLGFMKVSQQKVKITIKETWCQHWASTHAYLHMHTHICTLHKDTYTKTKKNSLSHLFSPLKGYPDQQIPNCWVLTPLPWCWLCWVWKENTDPQVWIPHWTVFQILIQMGPLTNPFWFLSWPTSFSWKTQPLIDAPNISYFILFTYMAVLYPVPGPESDSGRAGVDWRIIT